MDLVPTNQQHQTYVDTDTGLYHLVSLDDDGTPTSLAIIAQSNGVVDTVNLSSVVIQHETHEVHEQNHYFIKTVGTLEGAAAVAYVMFRTPDTTTKIHARFAISAEAEFNVKIYEGATVSDDGAAMTGFNNWRDSTNTPELAPFAGPTVTTPGTLFWEAQTGTGKRATGVSPGFGYPLVVKRNSIYLFKITKAAASAHYYDIDFWWYEEVPHNI